MELEDIGHHCSISHCHQKDFLPFKCKDCNKYFCNEHFKSTEHICIKNKNYEINKVVLCPMCHGSIRVIEGEDINITYQRHVCNKTKIHKCPVKGCKEKLTTINTYQCKKCHKKVCLKHRMPYEHECIPDKSAKEMLIRQHNQRKDVFNHIMKFIK